MRRMMHVVAVLALAGPVLMSAPEPVAASGPAIQPDLDGKPIAVEAIPDYFCHDREFPVIHCFRTAPRLEAAVEQTAADGAMVTAGAGDYVVMFAGQSYSSSYMYVSQNYDALALIGWNDRVRSYRGLNSALGTFWTDWFASGLRDDFCCSANVPQLGAGYDRAFSSVYRR